MGPCCVHDLRIDVSSSRKVGFPERAREDIVEGCIWGYLASAA